jgi:hypothetical protein
MATNEEVADAWRRGNVASAGNYSTDGKNLYSYNLKIGYTGKNGEKKLFNYTSRKINGVEGHHISTTTSKHVTLASRGARVQIVPPPKKEIERRRW